MGPLRHEHGAIFLVGCARTVFFRLGNRRCEKLGELTSSVARRKDALLPFMYLPSARKCHITHSALP